jgi:anti-sigma-K factor RskA
MERHVNPEDPDLYALGALDGEEKRAFEAHVRVCAACAAELEAACGRVALLALATPAVTPPAAVKDGLMRQVGRGPAAESAQPARRRTLAWPASGWLALGWLTPALAATTVGFAVLAGWLWARNQGYARQVQTLQAQLTVAQTRSQEIARAAEETDHLLGMPGTVRVSLMPQSGTTGRAGVLYNSHMGMVMCAGQIAPAPTGKSYQLWLVPMNGKPMSLGVFSESNPMEPMMAHVPPGMEAKAFAITVEPAGGMPWPTGPKVLMGALEG